MVVVPKFLRIALKPFTLALSYTLFYIGGGIHRLMWMTDDRFHLYRIYNRCMLASLLVQGWTLNKGPWKVNFGGKGR